MALLAATTMARAQSADSAAARPATRGVRGGYDDKPYLSGVFGRILVGGYVEARGVYERADGVTEEAGFEVQRWNIFTSTQVSPAVTVWAELEFEDGGEEVRLELAQIDVRLRESFQVRGGMLLLPIGRFNLAHDGPRHEFTDRPLEAADLLGVTLSQPGLGLFGRIGGERGPMTYEAYAVNGYMDGLLLDSPEGTRLPAGRTNVEDQNNSPAVVGRAAASPRRGWEAGLSGYHGAYNVHHLDGMAVDERRDVSIGVLDLEASVAGFGLLGEGTLVQVDIPPALTGINASRQAGFYLDLSRRFAHGLIGGLPASSLTAAVRLEAVDFDRDLAGDSVQQLSVAFNLRTSDETVVKLNYARGRSRDRFNNAAEGAALTLGVATYF